MEPTMYRLSLSIACAAALQAPLRTPLRTPMRKPMITMGLSKSITDSFPALVAGAAVVGATPIGPTLLRLDGPKVTAALALTMLAMGTTLETDDFRRVATRPKPVAVGFLSQFCVMPASAVLAAALWRLPPAQAAGVCLVGCCPGGVASNVVSLLARADVPLSITMTTCSTVAACFLTPILAALCAGAKAELNRAALAASTVQVVLAPVALGLALRSCFPKKCDRAQPFLAPTAALLVAWICGSVVAKNSAGAAAAGAGRVLGALLCLHGLGFGLGYGAARAAGLEEAARRTVSIETGMQNSALAVVLAGAAGLPPAAKLPGAISATIHSIMGSVLARRWRRQMPTIPRRPAPVFERVAWSGTPYPARTN